MSSRILKLSTSAIIALLISSKVFAYESVADSIRHADDGTHHFLSQSHDYVLVALVLVSIALLVINHFRIKSQKALRESEQRFQALAERSVVGISVVQDGIYRFVNPRLAEMFGYSQAELIDKKGPSEFIHPDDRSLVEKSVNMRISGEEEFSHYEARMINAQGETRFVEVFGSRMTYRGQPAVIATLLDITERKKTAQALEKAHSDLNQIFDSAAPLYVIGKDFTVLRVNDTFCQHIGLSAEELTGRKCYDVWPGSRCGTPDCPMETILESGEQINYDREHVHVNGRVTAFNATALPYLGVDGSVQGIIASFSDITELKKREKALQASEEKSRAQFVSIPVPTYIWQWVDGNFVLRDHNDQALKITGGRIPEFLGSTFDEIYPDRPEWKKEMTRCLKEQVSIQSDEPTEYVFQTTGERRFLSISFAYVPPDFVMVHTADITERTLAELGRKENEQKLSGIINSISDHMSMLDRDLNIVWANDVAKQLFGPDIISKKCYKCYHGREKPCEPCVVLKTFGDGEVHEHETRVVDAEGNARVFWCTASVAASDRDGNSQLVVEVSRDITERKQAEQALVESESRFRELAEKAPVGIYLVQGMKVAYANPAVLKIIGAPIEAVMKAPNPIDFVHPDDRQSVMNVLTAFAKGEIDAARYEIRIFTGDGTMKHLELTASPTVYQNQPTYIGTAVDITERKRADEALKESEDRFKTLAEQSPVGIYVFRDNGFSYVNPRVAEILGYVSEDLIDLRDVRALIHPDDRDAALAAFDEFANSNDNNMNSRFRVVTREGLARNVEIYVSKTRFEGRLVQLGSMVDVTARIESERALAESERKFRTLAETSTAAIIIYNDRETLYTNPAAEIISGYSTEELRSMQLLDLAPLDIKDELRERAKRRMAGLEEINSSYEVPLITKSGRKRWVLYTGGVIQYGGSPAVLGTAVDITESKKAQAELHLAHEERYDQVKQIAGGVAHEIYNALFPASSTLDKLKERIGTGCGGEAARDMKLLSLAETSVERAIEMTELVTQLSKLDSDKDLGPLSLAELFAELLTDRERVQESGTKINLNIDDNAVINMSRVHAFSLFNNLVNNALDALEEVDGRAIDITAKKNADHVKVVVADTGSGIDPEILSKIFNPFFSTKPRTGTGLGLAICKRIVDIYQGEISVESAVDRGTSFTILLRT